MKKIFSAIKSNALFNGIGFNNFEKMLKCMEARTQNYKKDDFILLAGNPVNFVGVILSGGVKIIKEDINGNVTILTELATAELFAEAFVCAGIETSPVSVKASKDCDILFINYKKIITTCSSACGFHSQLIENMLRLIAKKNMTLNQKLEILSKRSTRERLLMFFDVQRGMAKKFSVPYNREEMAHYLCVDRSAMSNELCKMRDDGIIRFKKNEFEIL